MTYTVPSDMVAVGNGKLKSIKEMAKKDMDEYEVHQKQMFKAQLQKKQAEIDASFQNKQSENTSKQAATDIYKIIADA